MKPKTFKKVKSIVFDWLFNCNSWHPPGILLLLFFPITLFVLAVIGFGWILLNGTAGVIWTVVNIPTLWRKLTEA